jgi:transcriptional regulator with GAF, ATPase, and Fis domain
MSEIVGVSENITRVKHLIAQIANTEVNTIICGETGVGKDLIVQALYQESNRHGKPFIKVNCAALPDTLLESEMFGYEKGAFTGAISSRRGKFAQANGGVLFLDEIGDMSLPLQAKLLRVLQDGEFTPLGSEKTVKTDAWVMAATNHDLDKDLRDSKFRQDLFYRLSTVIIHIEPLRNRPEDIPSLIKYYYKKFASHIKDRPVRMLSKDMIYKLTQYDWPGNVRELQNVLKRILIFNADDERVDEIISNSYSKPLTEELSNLTNLPEPNWAADPQNLAIPLKKVKKYVFAKIEKKIITHVLEKTEWNRTKASKALGISYKLLLNKINDLDIKIRPESNEQTCKENQLKDTAEIVELLNNFKASNFFFDEINMAISTPGISG